MDVKKIDPLSWRSFWLLFVLFGGWGVLESACSKAPDHVFDANGQEIDCGGKPWDQCVAAHCPNGHETIAWRDLGQPSTYRCKR